MKRKPLLLVVSAVLSVLASCETTGGGGDKAYLNVDTRSLTFGAQQTEAQVIPVDSKGMGWTVSYDSTLAPWLHVEQKTTSVSVSVDVNAEIDGRSATFTITGNNSSDPVEVSVAQTGMGLKTAIGDYFSWARYPELQEAGGGEFLLGMASTELDANRNPIGDGFILFLNFFAPDPELSKNPVIADGTYKVSSEVVPFSILTKPTTNYSEMRFFADNAVTRKTAITGGEFTVKKTGDNYNIEFDLTFDDGTVFASSWNGPIATVNQQYLSTHTEDVDATMRGGAGVIDAWGTTWSVNARDGSWEWDVRFWGNDLVWGGDMDCNVHGVGDLMHILIFADRLQQGDDVSLLPTGTYTINGKATRNTALWGGWDNKAKVYAGIWGSWYVAYNNLPVDGEGHYIQPLMGALVGGTITIGYNPSTKLYHIVVDAFTDAGKDVKIDFEGPLAINVSYIKFD